METAPSDPTGWPLRRMTSERLTSGFRALTARLFEFLRSGEAASVKFIDNLKMLGPPVIRWPDGSGRRSRSMACPNCGSHVHKPQLLTVDFVTSPGSRREAVVLRCPFCTCPFFMTQIPPDYAEEAMLEQGRAPFYLQQGAGLSLITQPLAQILAPSGSTYAEIGCRFGFGLDFAYHAKRWFGQRIDLGGIAQLGHHLLGVTIEGRYLRDSEPELVGSCDVVMASKTIAHVISPSHFVCVLRDKLRESGTLVLTTPNGADLKQETAPNILIGLFSPGLHLIFQTEESLRTTRITAGFVHVIVTKDGHSLVAFASDRPMFLETDRKNLRLQYRTYLEQRATDFSPIDDMFLAFEGRVFQEAMNDGAIDQTHRARILIEKCCRARFGHGFEKLSKLVAVRGGDCLQDLAMRMPLNLGSILFSDAMFRLTTGTLRSNLREHFLRAADAAALLTAAIETLALADRMSEEIGWTSHSEAILCAAAAGADDVVAAFEALPPGPDACSGEARRDAIGERILTELVNASHNDLAMLLCDSLDLNSRLWADPTVVIERSVQQRNVLFSLAVLDLQRADEFAIERSLACFELVARIIEESGSESAGDLPAASRIEEIAALDRLGNQGDASTVRDTCSRLPAAELS